MHLSAVRDFVVGLFVLAGLGAVAYLSFSVGGVSWAGPGGLTLNARFSQIAGLNPRAPVEIAGVRVGRVTAISLDENYLAKVEMELDGSLELPTDTSASIVTAGVLGDRYVQLQVGGAEEILRDGEEIAFTESAIILERLIGQMVHGAGVEQ